MDELGLVFSVLSVAAMVGGTVGTDLPLGGVLPVDSVGGALPVDAVGGVLPVGAIGGALPVDAVGGALPVDAVGGALPVGAVGGALPAGSGGNSGSSSGPITNLLDSITGGLKTDDLLNGLGISLDGCSNGLTQLEKELFCINACCKCACPKSQTRRSLCYTVCLASLSGNLICGIINSLEVQGVTEFRCQHPNASIPYSNVTYVCEKGCNCCNISQEKCVENCKSLLVGYLFDTICYDENHPAIVPTLPALLGTNWCPGDESTSASSEEESETGGNGSGSNHGSGSGK